MSLWQLPAILLALLAWLQSQPASLADVASREALRRQLMPKSVQSFTNDDVNGVPRRPLPTMPVDSAEPKPPPSEAADPGAATDAANPGDEASWRKRMTEARVTLDRDQVLAEALQSRINGLAAEFSARDDPAQRQKLFEQRERAIDELERMNEQVDADKKSIATLEEDARRQNVPAGWIR